MTVVRTESHIGQDLFQGDGDNVLPGIPADGVKVIRAKVLDGVVVGVLGLGICHSIVQQEEAADSEIAGGMAWQESHASIVLTEGFEGMVVHAQRETPML